LTKAESQIATQAQQLPAQAVPRTPPVLREYRGVKLDLNRDGVKTALGKAEQTGETWEQYMLGGGDLITVHYNSEGLVKAIQLYFTDASRAPSWTEAVGDVLIQTKPTGARFARAENKEENFWVTMFQSKNQAVTTITISR
jgi:hypothetical protein